MPSLRDVNGRLPLVPYVCPDGRIVDAQWALAINHEVLTSDEGDRSGRTVQLRAGPRRKGYRMLEELYAAAGWPEGFGQYLDWARSVYHGDHRKAFPEKLLPQAVLERRKAAARGEVATWQPKVSSKPEQVLAAEAELDG